MPDPRRLLAVLAFCAAASTAGAAASPTAVPGPLPLPCDLSQSATSRRLARDESGSLWLAAHCVGQVVVTVTHDGGATWEPWTTVWPAAVTQLSIEGGTLPGHAIVAWETFTDVVMTSVTTDFGATWSAPVSLFGFGTSTSGMSAVAEADRYHVMAWSAFSAAALVRTSPNRGATWNPVVSAALPWAFGDLVHDEATDAILLVADSPSFFERTSTDHAATFAPVAPLPGGCCLTSSDWAFGGLGTLIGVGGNTQLWRFDLSTATATAVPGLPATFPAQRAVDADAADTAYTAGREQPSGAVSLHRIPAGAATAGARILLDDAGDYPAVQACETGSGAVAWRTFDGSILFDKTCADGSWSCCQADVNQPPLCDASGPHAAECEGSATAILLDGRGSSDPEGAPLAFSWSTDCPAGRFDDASAPAPTLFLDGSAACDVACSVTLSVSDGTASSSCTAAVSVRDTTPPAVAASSRVVATLWPPNHRLVAITEAELAPVVADACAAAPAWTFAGCLSDQPDDATGDGETEADCLVAADGRSVLVRAERDGARPEGRTYSILVRAQDPCGNAAPATVAGLVHVPHDRR